MKNKKVKIIKIIISIIILILSLICFKYIKDMNILPNKYLYLFLLILLIINLIAIFLSFKKGKITKIISGILYILIGVISILGIKYSSATIKYLNKGFNNNVETTTYNVIVLKNSNYKELKDLNNTKMGYLFNDVDNDKYLDKIKEEIDVELKEEDFLTIYTDLINNEISAIIINEAYLDIIEEQYKDFSDNTKILYSLNIKNKVKTNNDILKELKPVNIYISGSDSRSNTITDSTLSDVNIIVTLNPKTHTMLLTNIPRDYYVQLHGTTGTKDKLTHAGLYGIEMSKNTLEDLFGIEIDYSIKLGFQSVVEIVDLVGGIEIYSDTAFNSFHKKGWYVKKGINYMDGEKALAYARERYAYSDGDSHRGRNQQQVIEAIFNKIVADKTILLKYDSLLSKFSKLYRTDIPKEFVTLLIKQQLEDMSSWTIEKQSVEGKGTLGQTYSMPGPNLYITIPNQDTINSAVQKINEVSK
ncbi:MAG: LCP family protein [Bacilli bacterium]|nr:LCP family protein [Bacilli bacterium]